MCKEIQVPVQVENISYPFLLFSWVSIPLSIVMVQFASTNTLEPAGTSNPCLFKIQMHKETIREW